MPGKNQQPKTLINGATKRGMVTKSGPVQVIYQEQRTRKPERYTDTNS